MPAGRPQPLKDLLPQVMSHLGCERGGPLAEAIQRWPRVAGKVFAAHARPTNMRAGCLTITATSTEAVFELTLRRQELLRRLKRQWPTAPVTTIRVRLGDLEGD